MMKIKSFGKIVRLLGVSATLGMACLSATSNANMPPSESPCERDVRVWCYWNWYGYYYDESICVSSERLRRCEDSE